MRNDLSVTARRSIGKSDPLLAFGGRFRYLISYAHPHPSPHPKTNTISLERWLYTGTISDLPRPGNKRKGHEQNRTMWTDLTPSVRVDARAVVPIPTDLVFFQDRVDLVEFVLIQSNIQGGEVLQDPRLVRRTGDRDDMRTCLQRGRMLGQWCPRQFIHPGRNSPRENERKEADLSIEPKRGRAGQG